MQCPKCNYVMDDFTAACPRCARLGEPQRVAVADIPTPAPAPAETSPQREVDPLLSIQQKSPLLPMWARVILYLFSIAVVAAIVVFGNWHIVSSGEGTLFVKKIHFTFSETFVSLDAITGMSIIDARAQYPLTIKALQRDDIIESDEEREARIERELKKKREEIEREINENPEVIKQRLHDAQNGY